MGIQNNLRTHGSACVTTLDGMIETNTKNHFLFFFVISLIIAFWKFSRLGNLAWDFLGVNFLSRDFLGFCWKS